MGSRLADRIADGMMADGCHTMGWNDHRLVDYIGGHTRLKNSHPMNVMRAACDAMDRAPDRFEKFYRRSADIRGNDRIVRCFRLLTKEKDHD